MKFTFATSNRSSCKSCKKAVEKDISINPSLYIGMTRVGIVKGTGHGDQDEWYHTSAKCVLRKIKFKTLKCKVCSQKCPSPMAALGFRSDYHVCFPCIKKTKLDSENNPYKDILSSKAALTAVLDAGGVDSEEVFAIEMDGVEECCEGWEDLEEQDKQLLVEALNIRKTKEIVHPAKPKQTPKKKKRKLDEDQNEEHDWGEGQVVGE